jgi:hypothetical protein
MLRWDGGGVQAAKLKFASDKSDLLTMVNAYNAWQDAGRGSSGRNFARDNFLGMQVRTTFFF